MAASKDPVRRQSTVLRNVILVLCVVGICISMFALYIEVLKEKNPDYVALCDINSYMTCSRVLTSKWAKGFGLFESDSIFNQPNTVFGMAFFTFQASLATRKGVPPAAMMTLAAIVANLGSIYLGYILAFIIKDFCIVCVSTYLTNFLMLIASGYKLRAEALLEMKEKSKKRR